MGLRQRGLSIVAIYMYIDTGATYQLTKMIPRVPLPATISARRNGTKACCQRAFASRARLFRLDSNRRDRVARRPRAAERDSQVRRCQVSSASNNTHMWGTSIHT
jgi:hypothetical protein